MNYLEYQKMYETEEKNWWFVGKRKILTALLEKFLPQKKELKILDVGCGTGIIMKTLAKYGSVTGLDNSNIALDFCRKKGLKSLVFGSATNLPFSNQSFSLATASDILEHITDDCSALKEINRVLKNNGLAIISVPAFPNLWSSHDLSLGHLRRYTLRELKNKVKTAGFKIIKLNFTNFFLFPFAFAYRKIKKLFVKSSITSDLISASPLLNLIFIRIYQIEMELMLRFKLPFGLSLICVAQKSDEESCR